MAISKLTLEKQDGYLVARVLSNTQLQCLHGTIFGVFSQTVELQEGEISLSKAVVQQALKQQKQAQEEYQVAGDDVLVTSANLKKLPGVSGPTLDSAMTSVTQKQTRKANSLTTVLEQALQSDDTD